MGIVIIIGKVIGAIILLMFGTASISAGLGAIETRRRNQLPVKTTDRIWWLLLSILSFGAIAGGIYLVISIFT